MPNIHGHDRYVNKNLARDGVSQADKTEFWSNFTYR